MSHIAKTVGASKMLTFSVKTSGNQTFNITVADNVTILDLKTELVAKGYEELRVESQRLVYDGCAMNNSDTLSIYRIMAGGEVHVLQQAASSPTSQQSTTFKTPMDKDRNKRLDGMPYNPGANNPYTVLLEPGNPFL